MTEIPIEVYEAIAELNQKNLNEAVEKLDFKSMYRCFDRMTHALEQVEQYRMERARAELKDSRTLRHLDDGTQFLGDN